jgi:predicted PurR-regulated permease PerM
MPGDDRQIWAHWNITLVFAFTIGVATFLIISLFVFCYFFGFIVFLDAVPFTAVIVAVSELWKERTAHSASSTGVIT